MGGGGQIEIKVLLLLEIFSVFLSDMTASSGVNGNRNLSFYFY